MIMSDSDHDRQGFYKLNRTYSELYRRTNYLCTLPIVQNRITEYDIKSANTSCLRRAKKLKESMLADLEALPGHQRHVYIGKMIAKDKSIQKTIAREIIRAKRELFEANGVQDADVLSIKNDAVFIIGRKLKVCQFGPILFRPKNVYSLYMNIEKMEFYYDRANDRVDIKGVNDSIVEEPDHQEGMLRFFATVMKYLVFDRRDALRKYLIEFTNAYKEKELPVQYYRELNPRNCYRTDIALAEYSFDLTMASDADKYMIDGIYNYTRFILPIIQAYL